MTGLAAAMGTTTGGGDHFDLPCFNTNGPDVAYSWTAPSAGVWTIDTIGSAVTQTALMVLEGTDCAGAMLACNDDNPRNNFASRSLVQVDLSGGDTVTIVVKSNIASGDFVLNITQAPDDETGLCADGINNDRDRFTDCSDSECVENVDCNETASECEDGMDNDGDGDTDCEDIGCAPYSSCIEDGAECDDGSDNDGDGDTDCADTDCLATAPCDACPDADLGSALGAPVVSGDTTGLVDRRNTSCAGAFGPDMTYLYTAAETGRYTIDTLGSAFDTTLSILEGGCSGFEIACNDDTQVNVQSSLDVDLLAGQSVIIVVDAHSAGGAFDLNIAFAGMSFGAPAPDDLVITEIMHDPTGADAGREWFEIKNLGAATADLDGCIVEDGDGGMFTVNPLLLQASEFAVFAAGSAVGFTPSYDYADAITLDAGDTLTLRCGGMIVDQVAYDDGATFPNEEGFSMQLDSRLYDTASNDAGTNWCRSLHRVGPYDGVNVGSPGETNTVCP